MVFQMTSFLEIIFRKFFREEKDTGKLNTMCFPIRNVSDSNLITFLMIPLLNLFLQNVLMIISESMGGDKMKMDIKGHTE